MIYGKRVEVMEVEAMLYQCSGIEQAIVRAFTDEDGLSYMTAYVVPSTKVRERKGRLDLPIVSGKHLRRISDRTALQSADNAEKFITTRKIDSFESLAKFTADKEQRYQQLETVHLSKWQKLNR